VNGERYDARTLQGFIDDINLHEDNCLTKFVASFSAPASSKSLTTAK